jgi:hypothetical protein
MKQKDASFWDEKWNPKNIVIIAQKKQNQKNGTTNPEG